MKRLVVLAVTAMLPILAACDPTPTAASETFPRPLGTVPGTHIVGAAVPMVRLQPMSVAPPNYLPEWSALARVDGTVREAIGRFGRQARAAGLVRQTDGAAYGCINGSCAETWTNGRGRLDVRIAAGGEPGSGGLAHVDWSVRTAPRSEDARALVTPRTGAYVRPDRGLGPGVEMLFDAEDPCSLLIGTVRGDAARVWKRWNRHDEFDQHVRSVQARVDGRTVRQLVRTGFDYDLTVTMISGGGLRRPVLAGSFCD